MYFWFLNQTAKKIFLGNCDKGVSPGVWCISEKTKVPFSTHDLIHFCNSYFICSMNLALFKRHINHASSCCFGWQPFFLEIFPIARAPHSTFMTRASPQGRRISNWKSLHWHWCLWRELWATPPAIWIMLFNTTFQFYWLPIITRRRCNSSILTYSPEEPLVFYYYIWYKLQMLLVV